MFRAIAARHEPARCAKCEGHLALQFSAPRALRTDTAFQAAFHGDGCRDEATRRRLHANAQRRGINIAGKKYDGRLAKYWGDPEACYSTVNEAKRAIARAGEGCEDLGVKAPEPKPQKPYRIADDIVHKRVEDVVIRDYGGKPPPAKERAEIAEKIRDQLTPPDGVCA